jgi:hypothetical protein
VNPVITRVLTLHTMQEAEALLEKRLPIPAYDHILKLSHTFNILDARGAVGLSERQENFRSMRALSKRVSELFLERRAELGMPLGEVPAFQVRPIDHRELRHLSRVFYCSALHFTVWRLR